MQMSDFLQAILPASGWYFAATPRDAGGWYNLPCKSLDQLTHRLSELDATHHETYYALASYHEDQYTDTAGKKRRRTQENAKALKSFWLDIDCGPGKPYPSKKAALLALLKATDTNSNDPSKLPPCSYLVSSGNGLHVYWTLDKEIKEAAWSRVAKLFKACVIDLGLHADHRVTANSAVVLRPVETHHRKADPKLVRLIPLEGSGAHYAPKAFATKMVALAGALEIDTEKATSSRATTTQASSPFATGLDALYPDAHADEIADKCKILGAMRDLSGADQSYWEWFGGLTILAHTVEGKEDALLHQWSMGHPEYDEAKTQEKIDDIRGRFKPTLCSTFSESSTHCATCPYAGKITSPISLGAHVPDPTRLQEASTTAPTRDFNQDFNAFMAKRYRWDVKQRLQVYVPETEKQPAKWTTFCTGFPRVDFLWRGEGGSVYARVSYHVYPRTEVRIADIPFSSIAQGSQALKKALGEIGVTSLSKPEYMEHYMQTWANQVDQQSALLDVRRAMGWQLDGSFLLGSTLYKPDGTVAPAVVSADLARYVEDYKPKGSLPRMAEIINRLYNRPDRIPHQMVWMASFASVFAALYDNQPSGLILSAVSSRSGTGKTSAAYAGISVWGAPYSSGQAAHASGATELAFATIAGQRRNLPVLFDETTNWPAEKIGDFAYRYSMGVYKQQVRAEGGLRDNSHLNWQNILYLTSNNAPSAKIAARNNNSAPMVARLFEVAFPEIDLNEVDPDGGELLRELLRDHTGLAGDVFIRALVRQDKERLRKILQKEVKRLTKTTKAMSSGRYWVQMGAFLLTAFKVTKKLGLHDFDEAGFNSGVERCINNMQVAVSDAAPVLEEVLDALLADLNAGLIATKTKTSGALHASAQALKPWPRGPVTGRLILEAKEAGLYLPTRIIRKWCSENQYDYNSFLRDLKATGWLLNDKAKYNLGVGTPIVTARPTCFHLDIKMTIAESRQLQQVVSNSDAARLFGDDPAAEDDVD